MAIKRIGAASEVITLAEARTHLRLVAYGSPLAHPDDAYITALITAAREWTEEYLQRAIGTQTLELALDVFPLAFELNPYVQSITSVKYIDVNNVEQTINPAGYVLDNYSTPAWLIPVYGTAWPVVYEVANAVKVRYVAGYDVSNPCPKAIISAMLLVIGNLYENRQENTSKVNLALPMGVYSLLQPYRLGLGV